MVSGELVAGGSEISKPIPFLNLDIGGNSVLTTARIKFFNIGLEVVLARLRKSAATAHRRDSSSRTAKKSACIFGSIDKDLFDFSSIERDSGLHRSPRCVELGGKFDGSIKAYLLINGHSFSGHVDENGFEIEDITLINSP